MSEAMTPRRAARDHSADIDRHVGAYSRLRRPPGADLVTVAVSYLHLPNALAIALALLVATIKGGLVACWFMHLVSERKLIHAVLGVTVFFFIALLALPTFTDRQQLSGP